MVFSLCLYQPYFTLENNDQSRAVDMIKRFIFNFMKCFATEQEANALRSYADVRMTTSLSFHFNPNYFGRLTNPLSLVDAQIFLLKQPDLKFSWQNSLSIF